MQDHNPGGRDHGIQYINPAKLDQAGRLFSSKKVRKAICYVLRREEMKIVLLKNSLWQFLYAVIIGALLCSFSLADEFSLKANGEIVVDGQRFAGMEEYLQSDYFRENGKRCGVRKAEVALDEALAESTSHCTYFLTSIQDEYQPSQVYTLPVWWHVITDSNGQGYVSDSAIRAQMEVLNEDYRATQGTMGETGFDISIQFELAGITRTANTAWFTDSDADEDAYKQALAVDPDRYINIYSNDGRGYLGYAYYPQGSAGAYWDGIVLMYGAVGGRNNGFGSFDQGRTLVHEMGHYLGLFHTFEHYDSICDNSYSGGDRIVDTNAESEAHLGCSQTYTCGTADPIHNYMNYTNDTCMNSFSREQANRSVCSLVNYRPGLMVASEAALPAGDAVIPPFLLQLILNN